MNKPTYQYMEVKAKNEFALCKKLNRSLTRWQEVVCVSKMFNVLGKYNLYAVYIKTNPVIKLKTLRARLGKVENPLKKIVDLAEPFLRCHTTIGYNQDRHYVQKILDLIDKNKP